MAKYRGHEIESRKGIWFYSDINKSVESIKNIPCGVCNQPVTIDGHDACLGILPGLMNACCGHGNIDEAYIQFLDGVCVQGEKAFSIIKELKANGN